MALIPCRGSIGAWIKQVSAAESAAGVLQQQVNDEKAGGDVSMSE